MSAVTDDARLPLLTAEQMTDEQRRIYEAVVAGPRGRMIGPLRAAIHSPELAEHWSKFGEYLRYGTCIPTRSKELAIIVTGRRWTSQVEWWAHAAAAAEAGLPLSVIEAIGSLASPCFEEEADFDVYEYVRLLQENGHIDQSVYDAVQQRWGTRGVVELTAIAGYYTMVAMTLNAHQIPVPEPHVPLPHADHLANLPAGYFVGVSIA